MATPRIDLGFGRPFSEQLVFLLGKVNVPTQGWTDVWRDGHDTGFMVAGAYKADLLGDLRQAVNKAITESRSLDSFRQDFDRIVQARGWSYSGSRNWRTRLIYETNLRTSYQAGRYAQLTDPDLLKAAPFWRYRHSDLVQEPRHEHLAWDGLVLRHDDPWWQAHYPPNGWGCRCTVFAESARSAARKGYRIRSQAPDVELEEKLVGARGPNPRTVTVPRGIDPGWDYAPGARVAERTRRLVEEKAGSLPAPLARDLRDSLQAIPEPPPAPQRRFPQPIPRDLLPDFTERVPADVSTPARASAVRFEDQHRESPTEWGAFVSADGTLLHARQGDLGSVSYDERLLEAMRGNTFTHVHPGGGSFSLRDVLLSVEYGYPELRVVTADLRYVFEGLDRIGDPERVRQLVARLKPATDQKLTELVRTTQITPVDLDLYGDHLLWQRVAAELGLSYRRELS